MSSWTELHSKLYDVDRTIINKLEVLLTNQETNDAYLDHGISTALEEPLIFLKTENFDFTEMPREALLQIIEVLKEEKNQITSLFNQVNNERKILRSQNFKLMERLFAFENFQIEQFDRDFNAFLSRSIFLQYELTKKFLEMERAKNEHLEEIIKQRNRDINNLKTQISQLENKVVQAREMWKKSILETPSAKPIVASKLSTPMSQFESTTDSTVKSPKTDIPKITPPNSKPVENKVDELEASINDKIQNKIKELMGEKQNNRISPSTTQNNRSTDKSSLMITIPEDEDINFGIQFRARTATNHDLLTRSVNTSDWEYLMKSDSPRKKIDMSPVASNSGTLTTRVSFGRQQSLANIHHFDNSGQSPGGHRHTKTPSFIKPTESHLAKLKQANGGGSGTKTTSATQSNGKTTGRHLSQKSIVPADAKKKVEAKVNTNRKTDHNQSQPSSTKNGPTLSFLLDQNVSTDSIHLNISGLSSTLIKELETDLMPKSAKGANQDKSLKNIVPRKHSETDNSNTSAKGDLGIRTKGKSSTIVNPTRSSTSNTSGTTVKKVEKK